MRILLISRCPPYPLHLGDRLIVYHLARELSTLGHEIDLLALTNTFEDITYREHYADFFTHVQLFPESPRSSVQVLRRALVPSVRFPRRAADSWSPDLWTAVEKQTTQNSYDVVHVFGGISVYELVGAIPAGFPILITPYESYSLYLKRQNATSPPMRRGGVLRQRVPPLHLERGLGGEVKLWLARRFESFMFAPYRRVVVVSEQDAAELRALNPAYQVEVIPNGVDLDVFAPMPDVQRDSRTLLFIGNYEYAPNADAALWLAREVMPLVRARVPDARLQLVGNAPTPEIHALASESVEVVGRVDDVRPYYAGAAVFACGLRFGAGIKNKVLEAMAMGCPVVGTPLSADGIAAEPERDIVIADAICEPFADALIRTLTDADLRQRLSANGRALIETRYSWKQVAQRYETVYQQVAHP